MTYLERSTNILHECIVIGLEKLMLYWLLLQLVICYLNKFSV